MDSGRGVGRKTMGKIMVFGSINTDLVTYVDSLPSPGETITGGKFQSFPGGKGANQAVAAARAGATVEMFGCVGDDSLGREQIRSLEINGVSIRNIIVKDGIHSGIAQIMVDAKGRNLIAVAPGANFQFTPNDIVIPEYPEEEIKINLVQNEIPQETTETVIRECRTRKLLVMWNVAPAWQERPSRETLASVDFLICNQSELEALAGKGDADTLALKLLSWGIGNVIVTLGEKGSLLVSDKGTYYQAAFMVEPVDTVGAGDCFCGVLAGSLSLGMSVPKSLRRASAAAALSVTVKGAQTSMPSTDEIDRFISATR
jgi:ribokinase